MRTLSKEELDQVFAGQNATTLPTVTVTATRLSQPSSPYYGSGWGSGVSYPYDENTGQQVECYATAGAYYAIPWSQQPDIDDLRCEVNAAADPGMTIPGSAGLEFINKYAHESSTTGDHKYTQSGTSPSGYGYLTGRASAPQNAIYLYAGGAIAHNGTEPYTDPATGTQRSAWNTSMTAAEYQILTIAHEAAHGRGITNEKLAEGYAVNALKRYRQNGPQCP